MKEENTYKLNNNNKKSTRQCLMAMATTLQVLPVVQAYKQVSGYLHARATKGRCYRTDCYQAKCADNYRFKKKAHISGNRLTKQPQ